VKQLTPLDFFPVLDRPGHEIAAPARPPGIFDRRATSGQRGSSIALPARNGGIRHTSVLQPGEGVVGAGLAVVCFPKR